MDGLLPPWPLFLAFMAASLVLAVTPGPGVIYIVTRGALHGRRQALASVLGVAAGNLLNAIGAAMGLAALFAVSALAFSVVKFAGAAYLVWIGIRMLAARAPTAGGAPAASPPGRVFRDGFVVAAFNPKTAVFFAAFLPQFFASPDNAIVQALALGTVFVLIAAVTDSLYALLAASLAPLLRRGDGRWARRTGGGIFVGLGLLTALTGTRTSR
jgi:threonine/homoserine/homoserine lactone efflux protein